MPIRGKCRSNQGIRGTSPVVYKQSGSIVPRLILSKGGGNDPESRQSDAYSKQINPVVELNYG